MAPSCWSWTLLSYSHLVIKGCRRLDPDLPPTCSLSQPKAEPHTALRGAVLHPADPKGPGTRAFSVWHNKPLRFLSTLRKSASNRSPSSGATHIPGARNTSIVPNELSGTLNVSPPLPIRTSIIFPQVVVCKMKVNTYVGNMKGNKLRI